MPIHSEVLEAARRLCRAKSDWTFSPDEIVRALPHLNASSVRTHVVSRCCVNSPQHHVHRWAYFRRLQRGVYEVLPPLRSRARAERAVAEPQPIWYGKAAPRPHDTIHAVVRRDRRVYVAECLEVAVVTQGRSLDELVTNLREAIELHLEGESHAALGLTAHPRITVQYELSAPGDGAEA